MHELSVAYSIVEMATREMKNNHATDILEIEMEIGKLSGVQLDAFEFAWPIAVKNTALENAKKTVHVIPGRSRCRVCNTDFDQEQLFDPCPECNNFLTSVLSGRELKVKSITLSHTLSEN